MNLKSFGCSFMFGSDLADDGRDSPWARPSKLTWPALWATNQGHGYQCYARPGAGNLQILEKVLTHAASNEHAWYVIGWTWIDRFDYNKKDNDTWTTITPGHTDETAKFYYRDLHSQYRDKLTTLSCIKLAIDTLKQKDVPFIMTHMDDLIFETTWHCNPAIMDLQNYIRPYITQFEGKTFLDWSRDKKFKISIKLHPLEAAHQAAFEYINSQRLV